MTAADTDELFPLEVSTLDALAWAIKQAEDFADKARRWATPQPPPWYKSKSWTPEVAARAEAIAAALRALRSELT